MGPHCKVLSKAAVKCWSDTLPVCVSAAPSPVCRVSCPRWASRRTSWGMSYCWKAPCWWICGPSGAGVKRLGPPDSAAPPAPPAAACDAGRSQSPARAARRTPENQTLREKDTHIYCFSNPGFHTDQMPLNLKYLH